MRPARLLVAFLVAASIAGVTACDNLDVTNPNNPSRVTVVRSSQDALALVSNAMLQWFNRSGSTSPGVALSVMADEFSTGFADFGGQDLSKEPREGINIQNPANGPPHHATFPDYYGNIAALNTALQAVQKYNLVLRNSSGVDVTTEATAFAKFFQGMNHGYIALMFDRGYIYNETIDPDTLDYMGSSTEVQDLIKPYDEVMDTALAEMSAALTLASSKTFTYPKTAPNIWFLGVERTNVEFQQVIHTYMARLMVYVARNPTERQAVDWNAVIDHINKGVTADIVVQGVIGVVESSYKNRVSRLRTVTPGDFMRVDYRTVGPADVTERFRTWYALPWAQRVPFQLTTPDRRIVGAPSRPSTCLPVPNPTATPPVPGVPTPDCGLYMGYHNSTVFNSDRGLGQRSFYFFHRYGVLDAYRSGPIPIVNVAELDLLKAEGLIRLGRADEAIPLINKYRVANGGLPPVDINGVPGTAPNCVPRKLDGTCGSLWDAMRYEKRLETMGLEGGPAFYDARGWQGLEAGTAIQFPMPLRDLQLLRIEPYTFGGATGQATAPAPNPEKCPVVLPRCPAA
jgi:hypothetical protein